MSAIFGLILYENNIGLQREIAGNMANIMQFRGDIVDSFPTDGNTLLGCNYFAYDKAVHGFSNNRFVVVFEGEIYNLKQLITELDLHKETSEGEVFLASYLKFGLDFPSKFNGIFTVAIYDSTNKQLILARDHVGSHSLFYAKGKYGFAFATTIKALLKTDLVSRNLSLDSIQSYFSSTTISPPATLFAEIHCLRPGTAVCFTGNGEMQEHTYWRINEIEENRTRSLDDFAEEVKELLVDAITIREQVGGLFGSIVSGGVDTSVITAVLAGKRVAEEKLPVFSIDFAEQFYSDKPLQQLMYQAYNLDPHSAQITATDYWDIFQKAIANLDCPVNDEAFVGMYRVFQLARSAGCTSIFDGEAADELFFTGHVHSERRFQKYLAFPYSIRKLLLGPIFRNYSIGGGLPSKVSRQLFKLGLSDTDRRLQVLPSFYRTKRPILRNHNSVKSIDPLEIARGYLNETRLKDPLNIYYYGLIKNFLADDLLYKNERMAAAHQITNRTPFIDYRLVELALKIPEQFKVREPSDNDDGTKIVYKKAIKGIIPDKILERKKLRGFSIPASEWYKTKLNAEVKDLLFGKDSLHAEYLDSSYVAELFNRYTNGEPGISKLVNSILVFEMWLREYTT
jgi:asparagine synthase (glutamine-hydrolysing)